MITLKKDKVLYLQAGGPTSVINASFVGLYEEAKRKGAKVYVSRYGLSSLLDGNVEEIEHIDTEKLLKRPGSYFGSARIKLNTKEQLEKLISTLKDNDIHKLFLNGGNDSMDSALKIAEAASSLNYQLQVIGIPKTIDNDLKETDHTPGYASASKFIINAVASIIIDDLTYREGRVNIVEIMGRDSGYLTLAGSLVALNGLKADLIYIPEKSFSKDVFLDEVKSCYSKKKRCTVLVSEGIRDDNGHLIASENTQDAFGNTQLGGVSHKLSMLVSSHGFKTRAIELSVLQRSAFYLTSPVDVKESYEAGKVAFDFAEASQTRVMVSFKRVSDAPYAIKYEPVDLKSVAKEPAKMRTEFIPQTNNDIRPEFINYLKPLLGENYLEQYYDL